MPDEGSRCSGPRRWYGWGRERGGGLGSRAAASRINVALYRETGQMVFLPDVYDYAQYYATSNSSYLASRSVPVTVTGVYIDEAS